MDVTSGARTPVGYGFDLRARAFTGGKNTNLPRIYNSSLKGGEDPDLELDMGKLLIVQEDVAPDGPDDNSSGGIIFFNFKAPTKIKSIGLVDNEKKALFSFFTWNGPVSRVRVDAVPDATSQTVEVDEDDVKKLKVATKISFAISFIEFCVKDDQL